MVKEIKFPAISQYFLAYTEPTTLHVSRNSTTNQTVTGQPDLLSFDTIQDLLTAIDVLTFNPGIIPDLPIADPVTGTTPTMGETIYNNAGTLVWCRVNFADININPELFVDKDTIEMLPWVEDELTMVGDLRSVGVVEYMSSKNKQTKPGEEPDTTPADWSLFMTYMLTPIASSVADKTRLETASGDNVVYQEASTDGKVPATHTFCQVTAATKAAIEAEFPVGVDTATITFLEGAFERYNNSTGNTPAGSKLKLKKFIQNNGLKEIKVKDKP